MSDTVTQSEIRPHRDLARIPQTTEDCVPLPWVTMLVDTYANAIESAAKALRVVEGEDNGILLLLSERAKATARVLWNLEAGDHSTIRSPELEEAWEASEANELMQRILWTLPMLDLGVLASDTGQTFEIGDYTTPWVACVTAAENAVKDMRDWIRVVEQSSEKEVTQ